MRHRTSPQQAQINAEYEARRQQAVRDWEDERALRLAEKELGAQVLHVEA